MDHETRQALLTLSLLMRKNKERQERIARMTPEERVREGIIIEDITPLESAAPKEVAREVCGLRRVTVDEPLTIRKLNEHPINQAALKVMEEMNPPFCPSPEEELYLLQLVNLAADEHAEEAAEWDVGQMLIASVSVKAAWLENLARRDLDWEGELYNILDRGVTEESISELVEAWPFKESLRTAYVPDEDLTR